jgi:RND family efflux transporter MFP subunit
MPTTNKQNEEDQPGSNDLAAKLERDMAELDAEAKPPPTQIGKPGSDETKRSPGKRPVVGWVVLLLVIGLAGAGYVYRTRLLRLASKDNARTAQILEAGAETKAGVPEGAIQISPERQQLIGVQYGEAAYKSVSRTLRVVGRLAYDETKITRIHPKIEGWVEQVFVDFTGKQVRKGEPLLSLYSPDLLQTQQEFLLARRGRDELSGSPFREAVAGSESLYQAARKRLELWDVSEEQIRELEKTGKPSRALTLYAPGDGFVLARNAYPKQRVTPDTELYAIADLSSVWVLADIYEYEAAEVRIGQAATVTLSYLPGRAYRGKVNYIYPQLDNTTRTLKARIEVSNPGFTLKPDMYANVELKVDHGRRVVVPQEAVMDSGAEQTVFVAHEGGYFEPRKVILGAKVDNEYIVLGGLKAGERVVTSANFLIDSESKLKSAAGGMGMPGMNHGGGHGDAGKTGQPPPPQADQLRRKVAPHLGREDHSQHQPPATPTPKKQDQSPHRHEQEERR